MTLPDKSSAVERRLNALLAKVVRAQTIEELYRVAKFRYGIYIEEQNKKTSWACPGFEALIEPADLAPNCEVLYVEEDGEIVSTLRIEFEPINPIFVEYFQINKLKEQKPHLRFAVVSRLMSHSSVRTQGIATAALFAACFDRVAATKHHVGLLSCRPDLIEFFHQSGFRQYADPYIHEDAGAQIPLINIADGLYLKKYGSLWAHAVNRMDSIVPEHDWIESIAAPFNNLQ